jgi:hypothetical protein
MARPVGGNSRFGYSIAEFGIRHDDIAHGCTPDLLHQGRAMP